MSIQHYHLSTFTGVIMTVGYYHVTALQNFVVQINYSKQGVIKIERVLLLFVRNA